MPGWLTDVLGTMAGGAIAGAIMGRFFRRGSQKRRREFEQGRPVKIPASLRGRSRPFPRRWRGGSLAIGSADPVWRPRFSILRRPRSLPTPAHIHAVRNVAGWREAWSVNSQCQVIVSSSGDTHFELAVLPSDLDAARSALGSP